MSLVDRTNEVVGLSIHSDTSFVYLDHDSDSYYIPSEWVHISYLRTDSDEEGAFSLTYEEARLVRDRLNLILGE